jgi:predicted outer membrane repeat protein
VKRSTHVGNVLRFALGALAAISMQPVHADSVFEVDTVADLIDDNTADGACHTSAGSCSLRAAVMQSNHPVGTGLIFILVPGGTYQITRPVPGSGNDDELSGNFNLNTPVGPNQQTLILGAGPAQTIVDGNALGNVFRIDPARVVTLDGMTIRNGATLFDGGGISNQGGLTVTNCVIENNGASIFGGGIAVGASSGASLTLIGSTLRSNVAGNGGAIYAFSDVTIRGSTLYGNFASDMGGAIYNNGQLVVSNSTISGNAANTSGGGIYSRIEAFLYNTSIIDNDADHDRDENGGIGGGIYAETGSGGRFVAVNTLIARNTVLDAPIYNNCDGALEVYGMNLFDEVERCTFSGNGAASWGLVSQGTIGALQDNGGPARTHALLAGSEAIDATNAQGCIDESSAPLTTDQRGAPRIAGARCDVGAYEFGATVPVDDLIFRNGFDGGM